MSHVARRLRTASATLAVLALTTTAAAAADAPEGTSSAPSSESAASTNPGPTTATFTLVTGDRVTAQAGPGGALVAPRLTGPDGGTDALWTTWTDGGDTYVLPEGAQRLLDAGTLDVELFNVSRLWRSGYDDATTATLPVIVQRSGPAAARAAALRGAEVTADLATIDAQGLAIDKDRAATVWAQLTGGGASRSAGGVEKVWLDRVVEGTAVTDLPTPTVPLTGAGTAHHLGFDGTGTTVAVLDTGYDLAHPDLAGRVTASRTFVGGAVQDANGHGTHTASTVAGTGAASDGRFAGVAPGADLLVGKVLGDDGSGPTSGILDGMEWAVEQGADVVSMSLGDASATSCTGPDVEMIEALSDEALFVVAAGNEGLRGQVSTPGCTPSALTVGAVDRQDETASFSSRGPVVGGPAAKPDIASQGVDVVAARTGGAPDFPYATMSGTSMATPHVAGAAALVVQAHPEWTPRQVKAALTSAAADTDAAVLDQGAGPLDAGRAVVQTVTAEPNVELAAPGGATAGADVFTDTVTLTNDAAHDVRLDLDVDAFGDDGDRLPGAARIDLRGRDSVVVPAHGTAQVPVAVDLRRVRDADDLGTVTGRVVGTARGGIRVTAPFWTPVEPPSAQVTVVTTNRFGEAPDSFSSFQVLDDHRDTAKRYGVGSGSVTLELPYGSYDLAAQILTRDAVGNHGQVASVSQVYADDVEVDGDTTVVLDARDASELSWRTGRPTEPQGFALGYSYGLGDDGAVTTGVLTTIPAYVKHLYTTPAKIGDRFTFVATTRAFAPRLELTSSGGRTVDDLAVALAPELDGRGTAPLVDVGPGTDANLAAADVAGKVVLLDAASAVKGGSPLSWSRALRGRGAVAVVVHVSGSQGRPYLSSSGAELPMVTITSDDAAALQAELAAGEVTMTWDAQPVATSPYVYNLASVEQGRMPSGVQRVKERDLAEVATEYHTQGADQRQWYLDLALTMPGAAPVYASGSLLPVRAPLERTELYTASPDVRWTTIARMTTNMASAASFDGPRTYARGAEGSTSWFATPLGLSSNTNGKPLVTRDVNGLSLYLGSWGDAAGHDSIGLFNADSVLRTVWVDGERTIPAAGGYAVPAGPAEVHVQQAFTRRTSLYPLGSAYTTDWWFTTRSADQGAQHSLVPVVDVDAGLTDRVAAGEDVGVRLAARDDATGGLADLDGATLEFAYGSQTLVGQVADWAEVPVVRGRGGSWTAVVPGAGAAGDHLHLRVAMRDGDGNRVEQSMIRVAAVR
ncbi:S8 family serine peptidase [Isoptericola hypogeus]|uniref:S8 family serine peptidase n=1 Tax=Isoptericola hypogeus TaxID=300179 RepID=A0ABP4VJ71_9MICO